MACCHRPTIDDLDKQSADEDSSDLFDIAKDGSSSNTDATSIEDDIERQLRGNAFAEDAVADQRCSF